ncbi:hypothetical protein K439DRAFT_1613939 [Ramaria rubella]|nr:hypothetical protein K439DRAFT_1613939 [Ramaria rubella]
MHPTAKHPHYPTIPINLFYGATNTSRNPRCHVEGISTPPNVAPTSLPPAPLHAPHMPQNSYMHHIHEPYAPYMRQSPQPSYTQAHGNSCPPSPLSAPPPSAAWPSMPGIGTWISGVNSGAMDTPAPLATCNDSSESLPGSTPSGTLSAIPPALTTKTKNALLQWVEPTSSKCTRIVPPSRASHTTEAVTLMKEEQELAQKFCETIVQSTAMSLELQRRGIEVAERAIQQQANFQNALLEVLAHGFQGTR